MPTRLRGLLLFTLLLVLAVGGLPAGARTLRRPTVEPTLPITVDMRLLDVERSRGHARARLTIAIEAAADLDEIELSLALPSTLRAIGGSWLPPGLGRMSRGQVRRFEMPIEAGEDAVAPIRLEAVMHLADGRTFTAGQGVTLEPPSRDRAGRVHLGAYEVMAQPAPVQGP